MFVYMYLCVCMYACMYVSTHHLSASLSIHTFLQSTGFIFIYICACVSVSICHVCAHAYLSQEKTSAPLELEFQITVSCSVWVLETEFPSNGRESSLKQSLQPYIIS